MNKTQLSIVFLLIIIIIAGCTVAKNDSQTTRVGKLILNQNQIKTVEVVKGAWVQNSLTITNTITDTTDINKLLNNIRKIPVNRLSKDEDNNFLLRRIQDEATLSIRFYDQYSFASLAGWFIIWPDGYIYAVDTESMVGNKRTISYLSESKYPEIYKWISDKTE